MGDPTSQAFRRAAEAFLDIADSLDQVDVVVEDKHYTPQQVAQMLDVHVQTVYRAIHAGSLEVKQIGKAFRIPASALPTFKPRKAAS